MALLTPLSLTDAQAIGHRYDLDVCEIVPLSAGSVNSNFRLQVGGGKTYFLRIYEEQQQAGAQAELTLVRALKSRGILTPAPLALRGGGMWLPMRVSLWAFTTGSRGKSSARKG